MSDVLFVLAAGMQILGEFVSQVEGAGPTADRITIGYPCAIVHTRFPTPQGLALVEAFEFFPVTHLEVSAQAPHSIVKAEVAQKYREARARAHGIALPGDGSSKPMIEL